MNAPIFNRDEYQHPADGWYQIEANGDHPNRVAGVVQVIDDEADKSIVNRFNTEAKAGKLSHGSEMLIDREHWKDDPNKETTAYGWLQELQARPDGIYGRIRWTATGQTAVDGGDYRFFSTEYNPQDLEVLNDGNPKRVRPLRLAGLTLTNMNNNKGQKPITNRAAAKPFNEDGSRPHQSEIEPGYPEPATEQWFGAVKAMQSALWSKHPSLSYQQCWNLTKRQHPDMYVAAFGSLSANPYADIGAAQQVGDAEVKKASDDAVKLTNRIQKDSGFSFSQAWEFARREAPVIFNRARQIPMGVQNRGVDSKTADEQRANEIYQRDAGNFLKKLAEALMAQSGMKFDQAWNQVRNREPAINALMCGRQTGQNVFAVRPDLFRRMYAS